MVINELKKQNRECLGCGVCVANCGKKALTLVNDTEGFSIVSCDIKKCIECEECLKFCPQLIYDHNNQKVLRCFSGKAEQSISDNCTAGGAFYLLARKMLLDKGYVCGVEFKDNQAQYKIINRISDLNDLLGAKYIEAKLGKVFSEIKRLLKENKKVLFCGTPCHVEALYAYLGSRKIDGLISVDFACHGVSSPLLLQRIIEDDKSEKNIININFSSKKWGFHPELIEIVYDDDDSVPYSEFSYFHNSCLSLKKSCYRCQFASLPHNADITLGIFYGIEKYTNAISVSNGISLILLNSSKGNLFFNSLRGNFSQLISVPLRFADENNRFFEDYLTNDNRVRFFEYIKKGYSLERIKAYIETSKFDVGLVTNWSTYNYGAEITHYALYSTIKQMGLEAIMIEKPNTQPFPPLDKPFLFRENPYPSYALSKLYSSIEEQRQLNSSCEIFIVGSDQVWNQRLFGHAFETFTLSFIDKNKKKISYATSFGTDCFNGTDMQRQQFKEKIDEFQYVSVRESSGKDILWNEFNIDSQVVLDPVFLAKEEVYENLMKKSRIKKYSPYVFIYMIWPDSVYEDIILKYAEMNHYEFICTNNALTNNEEQNRKWSIPVSNLFIEDWLYYIRNAEFVFADSFHAVCFSIIFKKNFLCLLNPDIDGSCRMYSLLSNLGLKDKIIEDPLILFDKQGNLNLDKFKSIDYSEVYSKLKVLVKNSENWLANALSIGNDENDVELEEKYGL